MDPFVAALQLYIGVSAVALLTAAATEPRVSAELENYARPATGSVASSMTGTKSSAVNATATLADEIDVLQ